MPPIRQVVKVDPARRAQWLMPAAVRYVDPRAIRWLLPVDPDEAWRQGDLLLVEVEGPPGLIRFVQNTNRRSELNYRDAALYPGTKLVAVLAPREGSSTCIARVPKRSVAQLHLHGVGGQAGLIVPGSQNTSVYRGPPTRVKVLARLGGRGKKPLDTHAFALDLDATPRARAGGSPDLVLVLGSDMDAGKTTAARRVIYALRSMGHPVVAGKVTGVASLFDIASMFDAGASTVLDFAALGEPVTIGLPPERVRRIFHQIFNRLEDLAGPAGFVVLEVADGIWYRETLHLLEDPEIRSRVDHVVFAAHSILDAEHGVRVLSDLGFDHKLRAITGKLGSSGVLRAALPERLGGRWPVFDSLDYETSPEGLAAQFEAGRTSQGLEPRSP